jgi:hypothetical protein
MRNEAPGAKKWLQFGVRGPFVLIGVASVALSTVYTAEAVVLLIHGADWAEATTTCLRVFDGENDGNRVYAEAHTTSSRSLRASDSTEADGRPGLWACTLDGSKIRKFRICEENVSCSPWVYDPS